MTRGSLAWKLGASEAGTQVSGFLPDATSECYTQAQLQIQGQKDIHVLRRFCGVQMTGEACRECGNLAPPPATAVFVQPVPPLATPVSDIGIRIGAYLIDLLPLIPVVVPLSFIPIIGAMLIGLIVSSYWLLRDITGASLGKLVLGLRVVGKNGMPTSVPSRDPAKSAAGLRASAAGRSTGWIFHVTAGIGNPAGDGDRSPALNRRTSRRQACGHDGDEETRLSAPTASAELQSRVETLNGRFHPIR